MKKYYLHYFYKNSDFNPVSNPVSGEQMLESIAQDHFKHILEMCDKIYLMREGESEPFYIFK